MFCSINKYIFLRNFYLKAAETDFRAKPPVCSLAN